MSENTKKKLYLLSAIVLIYVVGNIGAWELTKYIVHIDFGLAHAIPWLFLAVSAALTLVAIKGEILRHTFRFRGIAIGVVAVSILTWLVILYIYLKNVFPGIF